MEYALRHIEFDKGIEKLEKVLILVVMEYALRLSISYVACF